MRIVRLRRGLRITISDSEFEALQHLVELGKSDLEGDETQLAGLTPSGKRAMRARFSEVAAMRIDEDRRNW